MVRKAAIDLVSHSSLHTERLGERLGRAARPGDVFALWGELGAGKTVFVRGLARGLDVRAPVSSPTFVLVNEYDGPVPLFHVDFYRLAPTQLGNVGWEEYLDLGGVVAIEWPDRANDALPEQRLDVRLEHVAESKRAIRLEARGRRAEELLGAVGDALGA
ncbi:MAG: tRNA (adenosine(37)-N6)-threonylcarbamoyltransferase complex ATPase subunit type 1 TsaE [Chloroflexi bacterium 13_1_40CM_4_68_4]|nr:MAG: tRNA (adenosine(37)-N6)-threonylcarbamoyltransferase complex ATPase subunit type 1 TsaE [Chloroflexi bacterium 13_1_40CM_4_68_4]